MTKFTLVKATRSGPLEETFQLRESTHQTEGESLRIGMFHKEIYLGSFSIRQAIDGRIEMFIPSVPDSDLTKMGIAHFNLNYKG